MKKYAVYAVIPLLIVAVMFGFFMNRTTPIEISTKDTVSNPIFLDVRTDEEWNDGHLNGAVHFELAKLQKGEMPNLPKDADIAVYCRSGNRAEQAVSLLLQNNFINVKNVGGLSELEKQGEKVCLGVTPSCS